MTARVTGMEKPSFLGDFEGTLEIFGDSMVVSFEDSTSSVNPGETAHEEDNLTEETNSESVSTQRFIDDIVVINDITRPTINVRYGHNINDGTNSFISEETEDFNTEQDSGGLTELEESSGFSIEFIEEIAEQNESGGTNGIVNQAIRDILEGYVIPPVRSFEVLTPWQTVGKYLGSPFLNEFNFYQFAEVETPDTNEFLNQVLDFQFIGVKEEYADYVNQSSGILDKFEVKENVSIVENFSNQVVDSTNGNMNQIEDSAVDFSEKMQVMKAASIVGMASFL